MQEREKKEFYLTVKGQKTVVSEEVYRAYVRPIRAEQQKRKRERRCILTKVENGKIVQFRCKGKCSACEKYFEGNKNIGIATSFDELVSNGFDIQDITINIEEDFLRNERYVELHKAIARLNERQQEIVKMVYFEEKRKTEVAKYYGISNAAVTWILQDISARLKKFLEN